jgi:hypothetical protein
MWDFGGQSGAETGFLRVLRFPLPILIPPTAPYHHLSSRAGTIGQLLADVQSELSLTPSQKKKKISGFESASELNRSSDRRRSAKLVPTLADRGCNVVSATKPSGRNFDFLYLEPLLFLPSSTSNCSRG